MLNEYGELPIPPYIKTKDTMENNQKNIKVFFQKPMEPLLAPLQVFTLIVGYMKI